ncbi:hypothetical protein JCM3765_004321 [Sporobolomyces pararoseus]
MYLLSLLSMLPLALASPLQIPFLSDSVDTASTSNTNATRVSLSLGVMSRCPDAEICETLIDRVLDTHTRRTGSEVVGDLVNLKLIYLAKENSTSDSASYGNLTCLHGPLECKANVQQLCAASHWSRPRDFEGTNAEKANGAWKDWWNFVQCMNYGKRDKIGEDSVAKSCAKVVGREWTRELEACSNNSSDSEGARLFRKSVEASRKLKIEKSCTIVLNGKKLCVHDGSWKECPGGHEVGDIVQAVKAEYDRLNSPSKLDDLVTAPEDREEDDWLFV